MATEIDRKVFDAAEKAGFQLGWVGVVALVQVRFLTTYENH